MGVVYRHTVESLVKIVRERRALSDRDLTALGLYPPRDVSIDVWSRGVVSMAAAMFPSASAEQQLEESGRVLVRSFVRGVVGVGMLLALRLVGRRRALLKMADNFRAADSVMELSTAEKSPRWVQLSFTKIYGLEAHILGVIREAMTLIDAKTPCTVEGCLDAAGRFTIDVKW